MYKLTSETASQLKTGDRIVIGRMVVDVINVPDQHHVTVKIVCHPDNWMIGRVIYSEKNSTWYGRRVLPV